MSSFVQIKMIVFGILVLMIPFIKLCMDVPDSRITTVHLATGEPVLMMSCLSSLPGRLSPLIGAVRKKAMNGLD